MRVKESQTGFLKRFSLPLRHLHCLGQDGTFGPARSVLAGSILVKNALLLQLLLVRKYFAPGSILPQNALMSASHTEVGMAKSENASSAYRIYWTQDFAKPM